MKLCQPPILLTLAASLPIEARPSRIQTQACSDIRYPPPLVRPPLKGGYQGHNLTAWDPPTLEHLFGIYYVTHTSHSSLASFSNLWVERYPIYPDGEDNPAGSQVEIDSWSTCAVPEATNCEDADAISTLFGHDLPVRAQGPTDKKYAAAWTYNATGPLEGKNSDLYAMIAWGIDPNGYDYVAQYETGSHPALNEKDEWTASITIASRNEKGIDGTTFTCLSSSLKQLAEELGDEEFSAMVSQIRPVHTDGRRHGEGPVECDVSCVGNRDIKFSEVKPLQHRSAENAQVTMNLAHSQARMFPVRRDRRSLLPWWGWMTIGLVFGVPFLVGLCVVVAWALCRRHRRKKLVREQRAANEFFRNRQSSSVVEPRMAQTV